MSKPLQKMKPDAMAPEEWEARLELAAMYRLFDFLGWTEMIYNHITVRVPGPERTYLINPFGLNYDEVTARNLVKVNLAGEAVDGSTHMVNKAGFVIHSAIHAGRPDVQCVLHTHTPDGVAVSAQEHGLLPISQQATIALSSIGYHDYEGIAVNDAEKPRLVNDLGRNANFILRNHGLLTVGPSVADACLVMFHLQRACEIQVRALSSKVKEVDPRIVAGVKANVAMVTKGMGGQIAWPALLRKLGRVNPGHES